MYDCSETPTKQEIQAALVQTMKLVLPTEIYIYGRLYRLDSQRAVMHVACHDVWTIMVDATAT